MREIRTSGSTRGQPAAAMSPAVLLYWLTAISPLLGEADPPIRERTSNMKRPCQALF